ncbi:MAG TPA: XRE family transcriptional regulator [Porphyromonadaceae bacterium]|jgi:transcriptional regulator with XRE-family HTH domain|uniref:helix-turn-helix domain-containing protein n=1 Tax=Limibacterium fermenti TaxID=3229863 RepID=UPI000E885FD7|nr:XRE family transcriptional regulator [Porphyromonadaceae bacterium]HBL34375.1 XRE family transcriptional regulator [Porphyromonadaceae bacterium]HBX19403.1 XRE family transcriptional regulator [Porphyromonadaceae bacterium]HBX46369.1 XRE family transcriptional regulator [Porphyromonadaceae bacterium]HCM21573.1 XRE family transcriptional regulator [Porphyromonadaceae bacterium]
MHLIYDFDMDSPADIMQLMAQNLQKRRLEKGLSRTTLSEISGVPAPTIAKFERQHTISLLSYVALAKALGHAKEVKGLLSVPLYDTMQELETINKNKQRKRGRRNERSK